MAIGNILSGVAQILLPKSLKTNGGSSLTPTFNPQQASETLAALNTNNHIRDLLSERISNTDDDLIETLMQYDPDVSAAVSAYLTMANTTMRFLCYTPDGQIDTVAQAGIEVLVTQLTTTTDYSQGFTPNRSLKYLNSKLRYMIMKRGAIGVELVINKDFTPAELRAIDTKTVEWTEPKNGKMKPLQKVGDTEVNLDIPNFFYTTYRQDPNSPYSKSFFISVINTVYARLQIINDLYNIMQVQGYPRMNIKIIEEVIMKRLPDEYRRDLKKTDEYIRSVIAQTQASFSAIRPDQPLVHTDSIETGVINETSAGMTMDIQPIINTLNAQNQAALKSMATVLGRGESGVNTASVEAQLFSMNATALNEPLADMWSAALTLALRLSGSLSYVEVTFDEAEMRPPNELEPAMVQKQARLQKDLSLGIITDIEYHLKMYGRLPPAGAPQLSGTNFLNANQQIDSSSTTPQSDQPNSTTRAATRASDKSAKSNINK